VDSCKDYGGQKIPGVDIKSELDRLDLFADATQDYVFSSHLLEHIVDYKAALKEWWRVIKPGGYLVLYLPHKNFYPNIGEDGANPDHKHDFLPDDILEAMKEVGSWEMLENEERNQANEYSFLQVYKKKQGKNVHKFNIWQRNPGGLKRCLVIRYGAIGDALMVSSILPRLKEQGYYITFNCTSATKNVLLHDPNIDEWLIQEQDFVPNAHLGPYWEQIRFDGRYDQIINLCESIEGGLLTLPGRLQHYYPDESRRRLFATVNYLERTHDIAGVPHEFSPKFYMTAEEDKWARKTVEACKTPVVAIAVNGSALHKVYPWTQIVVAWLLQKTPAHVFLLGDKGQSVEIQKAITDALEKESIDSTRLHPMCGKWDLRQNLSFVQYASCVLGPETGMLNAVCTESVPKVVMLSHSSKENLTKHWKNTIALEPDKERCPCYPCVRLHYSWQYCNQNETTQAAQCASSITPETVFQSVVESLGLQRMPLPETEQKSFVTEKAMTSVEAA
jgi:ADP-heptose:LPS heptosyltransferase/predicted SAM-dependent methyltransferase